MNNSHEPKKDLEKEILMDILTHFVYKLQTLLNVKASSSKEYSFIPIDQMNISQLRYRLNQIESKVTQLTQNPAYKKHSINILLDELNEENDLISQEIDSLKNKEQ